ncbi:hypothetical protein HYQ46_005934 [Verticillium longisporum]|nr:hypothetical protein HYQ44_018049 [Verticillium longisporum]KAG7145306.1 hypothetical protein HYQ46_005934 [Verticillium longisporum]
MHFSVVTRRFSSPRLRIDKYYRITIKKATTEDLVAITNKVGRRNPFRHQSTLPELCLHVPSKLRHASPSAYQEISIEQSSAESDESVETGNRRLNIEMPGTAFKLYGASVLVLRVVSDGRPYGRVLYKNSIKNLLDRHVETRTCRAGFA